jgi:3-hydroxyacyl-CoA dehydrogenase
MQRIQKAAVLGAGTMGAQIAAHLANAGIPVLLLDIPPRELSPDEQAKGLELQSAAVRNRIARNGLEAAKKAKPAAFFKPELSALVTVGNFDDDLAKLKDCDQTIAIRAGRSASQAWFDRRLEHEWNSDSSFSRRPF